MKAVAYIAGPIVLLAVGFLAGLLANLKATVAKSLRQAGLNKAGAKLYRRCILLLNRMTRITELDGQFSEDVLSDTTRKEIDEILNEYRKGLQK